MLVLDASVTLAWVLDENAPPHAELLYREVVDEGAIVPAIWWLEVGNTLIAALRRRRIDRVRYENAILEIGRLPIEADDEPADRTWLAALRIADAHGLTSYDASYIDLAQRRGLSLASFDAAMIRAASDLGVPLA